jgi:alcohol dehydrogenase
MGRLSFHALVVHENAEKKTFDRSIEKRTISDLPDGEVLVRVHYSSLNYKDALSATGHKGVTKTYPHTPGIDAAGIVDESESDKFTTGDKVIVTGYDLGMNTAGGFGEYIRVPAGWVVPLPETLTLKESMIYGTAGFTAGLALHKFQLIQQSPELGSIVVTGATGGVGTLAILLLSRSGFTVHAVTGKSDKEKHLKDIGASEVLTRNAVKDESGRGLLSAEWGGAVDTVGGNILSTILKSVRTGGTVISCGNAASNELETTVYPFILRGVNLLGITSAATSMDLRNQIWQQLATSWKIDQFDLISKTVRLEEINREIQRILSGEQTGRVVLKHNI